jgi:hypothetical protein
MDLIVRRVVKQSRCILFPQFIAIILILLFSAGCFGGGNDGQAADQTGGQGQPVQATLTCSEACAQNGQCGPTADGRVFVLARSDRPNTRDHDLIFPVDVPVEILINEQRTIQSPGGEPVLQAFSHITLLDRVKTGWVADWCVVRP